MHICINAICSKVICISCKLFPRSRFISGAHCNVVKSSYALCLSWVSRLSVVTREAEKLRLMWLLLIENVWVVFLDFTLLFNYSCSIFLRSDIIHISFVRVYFVTFLYSILCSKKIRLLSLVYRSKEWTRKMSSMSWRSITHWK